MEGCYQIRLDKRGRNQPPALEGLAQAERERGPSREARRSSSRPQLLAVPFEKAILGLPCCLHEAKNAIETLCGGPPGCEARKVVGVVIAGDDLAVAAAGKPGQAVLGL